MEQTLRSVTLFTDGACSGNPGPGGWAFILRDDRTGAEKIESGADRSTTNNRMELLSVIRGLESLRRPCKVKLVTDSAYVADGIEKWLDGWKAKGWKRKDGNRLVPIKNLELWQSLDALLRTHEVRCDRIRGHAGHPDNEKCDRLAVEAYQRLVSGAAGDDG